jgi:hypothetical protein
VGNDRHPWDIGIVFGIRTLLVEYRNFCRSRQVTFTGIRSTEGPSRALHFKKTNKAFNLRGGQFESATPATISADEMPQRTQLNWPEEEQKKGKEKVRRNEAFRLQSVCFSHTQIIRLISAGHVGADRTTFFCSFPPVATLLQLAVCSHQSNWEEMMKLSRHD